MSDRVVQIAKFSPPPSLQQHQPPPPSSPTSFTTDLYPPLRPTTVHHLPSPIPAKPTPAKDAADELLERLVVVLSDTSMDWIRDWMMADAKASKTRKRKIESADCHDLPLYAGESPHQSTEMARNYRALQSEARGYLRQVGHDPVPHLKPFGKGRQFAKWSKYRDALKEFLENQSPTA